jgi:hypothetical protein
MVQFKIYDDDETRVITKACFGARECMYVEVAEFGGYPASLTWLVSKEPFHILRYGHLLSGAKKLKLAWDDMTDFASIWQLKRFKFI